MASCRRTKSIPAEQDGEEDCDEDDQTKQEFEDFKRWLDSNTPSGSVVAPSSKVACPKCQQVECKCNSSLLKFCQLLICELPNVLKCFVIAWLYDSSQFPS